MLSNLPYRQDMISLSLFPFGIFLLKTMIVENATAEEIVVAFSSRVPFVYRNQAGGLQGLDISIIENFAKRLNLKIKYIEYNSSFNEMFMKEETFENFILNRNIQ